MKSILFVILILFSIFSFAQDFNQKKLVRSGEITLTNDESIEFSNLTYEGEQVKYINLDTQLMEHLFLNSIKEIHENDVVYVDNEEDFLKEDLYKPNYPDGIYMNKEDFINKTPSNSEKVIPKSITGLTKQILNSIEDNCFFYYEATDKKIKNAFAISYQGNLYFQIEAILKNRNKTDRAQESDFKNSFVRVIMGGENYFYTEADLANAWSKGFAYGAVGGTAGHYLAQSSIREKGILWDHKNQEFNIFKHCKDYNDFMQERYPKGILKCDSEEYNTGSIQNVINQIK